MKKSLKNYNTFGVDVSANEFIEIDSIEQLQELIEEGIQKPFFVLGGGSNILFTKDYEGTVLKNNIKEFNIIKQNSKSVTLAVGAGNNWHETVMECVKNGWGGIENLSLIPGSVGAAPIQNIGAYGVELKDVVVMVHYIDLETGDDYEIAAEYCEFGYRDSIFKNSLKDKCFIYRVDLKLSKIHKLNTGYGDIKDKLKEFGCEEPTIADVSKAIIEIRQSKLPDPAELGNSGSFFKNPVLRRAHFKSVKANHPDIRSFNVPDGVKVPAGWLIENAGLKGKVFGNTGMHAKQALVLVNYGGATGTELYETAKEVQKQVYEKFDIELEMEVNVW
jgi:UDP-N-acetylmuramate dehydrogenase